MTNKLTSDYNLARMGAPQGKSLQIQHTETEGECEYFLK